MGKVTTNKEVRYKVVISDASHVSEVRRCKYGEYEGHITGVSVSSTLQEIAFWSTNDLALAKEVLGFAGGYIEADTTETVVTRSTHRVDLENE